MGREGIAFTFITPEEGSELTRIEMRINKLLKRDEIKDFESFAQRRGIAPPPPLPAVAAHERHAGDRAASADRSAAASDTGRHAAAHEAPADAETAPKRPSPPPFGGRTRRYRRAL
jgi:ATP-dependent RNA helicase DeaD